MKIGLYQRYIKRFFDVVISFFTTIFLLPVFFIIYICSLIMLKGNPIFKQYRPGKNGKIFAIYKFRSMTNKKDKNGELLADNLRITAWGKVLRKTSLDELPQLFNILKGDMSIVGPRPRLIKDMIFYDEKMLAAYNVRPGITGPAQVYDRKSEESWELVFARDIEYANNVTFKNDLKLFLGTFTAIFKGGSARDDVSAKEKREYYYPDYLLNTNRITTKQYQIGLEKAKTLEKEKSHIEYTAELHSIEGTANEK